MCIAIIVTPHRSRKKIQHKYKGEWITLYVRTELIHTNDPDTAMSKCHLREGESLLNTWLLP